MKPSAVNTLFNMSGWMTKDAPLSCSSGMLEKVAETRAATIARDPVD